jgi:DNA-binding MarR family transcriptional regulator
MSPPSSLSSLSSLSPSASRAPRPTPAALAGAGGGDPASRQVLDAIRRIVRVLRESSRVSERAVGLSAAQLFVLQRLAGATTLSVNELAARTLTHQSSVSVVVSRLVARGLVARRASAADGRRVEVGLTTAGRELLRRSPAGPAQDRLIAGLQLMGAAPRRRLAASLRALVDAMALSDEQPTMFFERGPRRAPTRTRKADKSDKANTTSKVDPAGEGRRGGSRH